MMTFRCLSVILIGILIDVSIQSYVNPEKRSAPTILEQSSAPANLEQGSAPTNLEQGSAGLRWRREETNTNSNKKKGVGKKNKKIQKNGKNKTGKGKKTKGNKSKKVGKGKKKSVKGKKKNGKGKKKNGKGKKKNGKGKKKNGKGKKKNGKGKKKSGKGKKKTEKGKKNKQDTDTTVLSCTANILDVFKTYTSKQRSIKRQISRTATKIGLIKNKKNKKDTFKTSYNNTMLGTGGDPKKPQCKAQATLAADVYTVLVEDLVNISQVLQTCPEDVDSNCTDPTTTETTTQVDLCTKYVDDFEKDLTACTKLTATVDVCACFTTMTTATYYAGFKDDCGNILKISEDAKTSSAACIAQFGKCKKAEDSAVRRVAECGVVGAVKESAKLAKITDIVFDDEEGDDDEDDAADAGDAAVFFM